MRLCRFTLDDLILTGYFADDRVIPIDQAAEAYTDETGSDLFVPTSEDLLDFLPPDGPAFEAAKTLSDWLDGLDAADREDLSVPVGDVRLLAPIGAPGKILLL